MAGAAEVDGDAYTPTRTLRPQAKDWDPLTSSQERLRQRCRSQVAARRAQVVNLRRADVNAICSQVASEEGDEDEELRRQIEAIVHEELAREEALAIAQAEEQEAYEQAELAALLETHLGVDDEAR